MHCHFNAIQQACRDNWFWLAVVMLFTLFAYGHPLLGLPDPTLIAATLQSFYHDYGLWIIALGLCIEGLFMVGFYFPGSFILVVGTVFTAKTLPALTALIMLAVAVTLSVTMLNYYLGATGLYRLLIKIGGKPLVQEMQQKLSRDFKRTLWFSAWHPNFLAIAVIGCGIARVGLRQTLRHVYLPVIVFITLWVTLIAIFASHQQLTGESPPHGIVLLFWLFVLYKCVKSYRTQQHRQH